MFQHRCPWCGELVIRPFLGKRYCDYCGRAYVLSPPHVVTLGLIFIPVGVYAEHIEKTLVLNLLMILIYVAIIIFVYLHAPYDFSHGTKEEQQQIRELKECRVFVKIRFYGIYKVLRLFIRDREVIPACFCNGENVPITGTHCCMFEKTLFFLFDKVAILNFNISPEIGEIVKPEDKVYLFYKRQQIAYGTIRDISKNEDMDMDSYFS